MNFKQTLSTKYKYPGVNTCEFLIVHHTGTKEGTIQGNINHLTTSGKASVHYIVDTNGDIYKIGKHTDIMRHCGLSSRKGRQDKYKSMSSFSIGIEVIGPLSNGGFTEQQYKSVSELIVYIAEMEGIPINNILRHKDITKRKVDIADTFWNIKHKSRNDYIKSLFNNETEMNRYKEIMEKELQGVEPLLTVTESEAQLNEGEVKSLINIAFARAIKRILGKTA